MSNARNLSLLLNSSGLLSSEDFAEGAVSTTAGMIHGFDVDAGTGVLTWTAGVDTLYDGNFNHLNDVAIVGTDDMTFSVDGNGHLIMTIG